MVTVYEIYYNIPKWWNSGTAENLNSHITCGLVDVYVLYIQYFIVLPVVLIAAWKAINITII